MHDALITQLWQLRGLRVRSRTAVLPYKNSNVPLGRIGRELDVDAVMEASIARENNHVRIIARLIDVKSGRTLWDSMYDRSLENVHALQSEVAEAIVSGIQVSVTPNERSRLTASRSVLPAAHDALLRGRWFAQKNTADGYRRSIQSLKQAIALDSAYAEAWAALGRVYNGAVLMGHLPPRASADSVRPVIDRALALDSGLADAHLALATLLLRYERDWAGAGREYVRAIGEAPGYAQAHEEYAWYLTAVGQYDSAVAEAKRTRVLDPLTGDRVLGWVYQRVGELEKSIAHYETSIQLDEDVPWPHALLAASYAMSGRTADAAAECDKVLSKPRESPTNGVCAQVYGLAGRVADARTIIREMEAARQPAADPYFVALAYTAVADTNKVLEWLETAYDERSPNLWGLKYANRGRFGLVRGDSAFQDIIRRMKYP
jgi:tetratricopeptide (TPR) repeat protein